MPKPKTIFVCSACGYESPRWYGKCPSCESWNTLEETAPQAVSAIAPKPQKQRGGTGAQAQKIYEIEAGAQTHEPTGIGEFDRVLGGGIVFVVRYLVLLLKEYYRKPEDSSEKEQ